MALSGALRYYSCFKITRINFSTSCFINNKWRLQQGLECEPREYGPLTNQRDYSFVDGRPTPLSYSKMQKVLHQQKLCEKIVNLTHEIDAGKKLFNEKKIEERKHRELILKNKLKHKGSASVNKTKVPHS